jgi:dihydropyrimidinase
LKPILVTDGTVVSSTTDLQADIRIEEGRIAAIGKHLDRDGCRIIEGSGCLVLPGGVDVHTHVNLSVGAEKVSDGFYHGTRAALHGGTTCIVEHPGFGPDGCGLFHQPDQYRREADPEAVADYGLHGVIQHVNDRVLADIAHLGETGISSVKVYLTYSGRLTDEEIIAVLQAAHRAGVLVCFHAENHAIVTALTGKLRQGNCSDPALHPRSRPDYAEAEAVYRLIQLARAAGEVPIYIVHLSTAAGLDVIKKARDEGSVVYAETCPQYLCLTDQCYNEADGLKYIMAPPLRRAEDCQALWQGLADGSIDVVATDHCSFSLARKKELGSDDIFRTPGGIPGVETRLPLLFSEGVVKQRIDLQQFVRLVATNPARIMGMAPHKGDIVPGADGDLVLLDPKQTTTLSTEVLHQQVDYTPFAGMTITGWPKTVLLRGRPVISDGQLSATRGCGAFIQRTTF